LTLLQVRHIEIEVTLAKHYGIVEMPVRKAQNDLLLNFASKDVHSWLELLAFYFILVQAEDCTTNIEEERGQTFAFIETFWH